MSNLQENFPYSPNVNFGMRRQSSMGIDQMASINKRRLENNDHFIQIISQQSLSQDQIEAGKREKEFEIEFDSLSAFYKYNDKSDVKHFLIKNKFLFSILKDIPVQIYNYFGNNQELSLKVSYEPDSSNSSDILIEVLTKLSAREAMAILDEFDEHWWHKNMNKVAGKLNITLKFV